MQQFCALMHDIWCMIWLCMKNSIHYKSYARQQALHSCMPVQVFQIIFRTACLRIGSAFVVIKLQSTYICSYTGSGLFYCALPCREETMPFTCALKEVILMLPSTLLLRWRTTCMTLMMKEIQHSTEQRERASCLWWNALWNPVDLMWQWEAR